MSVDLIEPAKVSIMLCCLNIALSKAGGCQPQRKQVELLGLRQQRFLRCLALVINGNFFQNKSEDPLRGGKE